MIRWAFRILADLSLVLCGLVLFLWVRSATDDMAVMIQIPPSRIFVFSIRTGTTVSIWAFNDDVPNAGFELSDSDVGKSFPLVAMSGVGTLGFALRKLSDGVGMLIAPAWFVFLLSAVAPAVRIIAAVRGRRRRGSEGLCRNCGYDLRATPERCPECGAVPNGI